MKKKLACGGLAIATLVAFAIFSGFGCGTMANMGGSREPLISFHSEVPPRPFGGVGRDLQWIASGMIFFVPDLPFSLVGDVITLPKVVRLSTDRLQIGICNGARLESAAGQSRINPSAVLNEIPLGSPIEKAQAVMEKHGFACTYVSTETDEKEDQVETSADALPTSLPGAADSTSAKDRDLKATVLKRRGLLIDDHIDRIVVTFHSQDEKVSEVEVIVRPDVP